MDTAYLKRGYSHHMNTEPHFLDRTLRLIKEELTDGLDDAKILEALHDTSVVIVSDADNAHTHSAQTAIVTATLLLARCGLDVWIDVPDVALIGSQPPLTGRTLTSALADFGRGLSSILKIRTGRPTRCDVALNLVTVRSEGTGQVSSSG